MSTEDRLREAIRARTSEVEPSPPSESLRTIERRLAASRRATARRRLLVGLTSAAAVLAIVVLAVSVTGDDDGRDVRTSNERSTSTSTSTTTSTSSTTTSTTEQPSTTSESTTPTTSSSAPTTAVPTSEGVEADASVLVWPALGSSTRFDDPVAAAQSFAVDLVGFSDPVVEAFEPDGSGSSGSVTVRPRAQGPATTVVVRQVDDGTWWVVSASTAEITLDQPATGTQIACPLRLTGTALAFEGTVNVTIRDDQRSEVGSGFVTGGGDVARPFDGTVDCSLESAGSGYGTVILTEASAEDGSVVKVVARRIMLLAG
jgi:Immunoglobulin-like domain of bacterial spore germination